MASPGAWIAHPQAVGDAAQVAVFSSELAALREAVRLGHRVTFVPYGKTLADAIAESQAEAIAPAKDWVEKPLAAAKKASK